MAILENGLKFQKIGSDIDNMQFSGINDSIRDEILVCFGVPASKLGLVKDVNRANAEANDYTYQKETVLPRLRLIEEKINEKIMPMYDEKLISKFDNPVPEDKEFRLKEKTEHIRSGFSSIDEERKLDDREPYDLPETEVPLLPLNLIPAGSASVEPAAAGTQPGKLIETKAEVKRSRKWSIFVNLVSVQERFFLPDRNLYR